MHIDVEKRLPVVFTDESKGPDGKARGVAKIEFKYPETGPANIYEAGAPRSAQIKPTPQQERSGEQVPSQESPQ
jgi:hypothetical protein